MYFSSLEHQPFESWKLKMSSEYFTSAFLELFLTCFLPQFLDDCYILFIWSLFYIKSHLTIKRCKEISKQLSNKITTQLSYLKFNGVTNTAQQYLMLKFASCFNGSVVVIKCLKWFQVLIGKGFFQFRNLVLGILLNTLHYLYHK